MEPQISVGDRLQMRKVHPCGSDEWVVYRVGADIGIRCLGCQRRVLMPRKVLLKRVKHIIPGN